MSMPHASCLRTISMTSPDSPLAARGSEPTCVVRIQSSSKERGASPSSSRRSPAWTSSASGTAEVMGSIGTGVLPMASELTSERSSRLSFSS